MALIADGSPVAPVEHDEHTTFTIGQVRNELVVPGLGM
ncbi:malic enzyme-like NAD(P)-binding protein [Mycobacterium uberis]|nr:malic enzyme-like NAD(P)-binding protein [Mycobacterium uberis]